MAGERWTRPESLKRYLKDEQENVATVKPYRSLPPFGTPERPPRIHSEESTMKSSKATWLLAVASVALGVLMTKVLNGTASPIARDVTAPLEYGLV
jgi:hypothetical protein